MYTNDREAYRQTFADAWQKHQKKAILNPQEMEILQVVLMHPEYHLFLERPPQFKDQEFAIEDNPFLHMGLHLAVREQVRMDRPLGIKAIYHELTAKLSFKDSHEVEHEMMKCLARIMWQAQQEGTMPDENVYLTELGRLKCL